MRIQKITPFLWFESEALEAAKFYCSIFDNSKLISESDMIVEFVLADLNIIALNGATENRFNESFSFYVLCENQSEIDRFWSSITKDGGVESQCGWCKDKYGLSWQIVPTRFIEMMKSGNEKQIQQVIQSMLSMQKFNISELEKSFSL